MSDKLFIGVIGVIIVGVIGAIVFFGDDSSSASGFIGDPLEVQTGQSTDDDGNVQRADHVQGSVDAEVVVLEYADFGCVACAQLFPVFDQVKQQYGNDIAFVFRHNPLSQIHPNAFTAHRAAVAADNQGMFWEMHDLLYERWGSWSAQGSGLSVSEAASVIDNFAQELGLDMEQFQADIESQGTFNFIDSHLDSGSQLGVSATPTVFVNGEEVVVTSAADLAAIIDPLLAEQTSDEATEN